MYDKYIYMYIYMMYSVYIHINTLYHIQCIMHNVSCMRCKWYEVKGFKRGNIQKFVKQILAWQLMLCQRCNVCAL